ncbi:MAG: winged helix-turn-helix transcriptional regulator [Acidimicrobiia bacterium]|nr:metalloregulator ArsR/SmtB family transcription factor [Acidimicrobiia bacterium]MBT8217948.1 metalloregulator ArsR/SmtB family transcription factor [Acidimicrobiia bacterium]NNF08837.1 winged helix-turn-helix transcriptional regulator [Acidimicrobiia bacterium]NNL70299.1 winged helix-turn-helix transcriptional regulator [Acidimicrobiia bacterium]
MDALQVIAEPRRRQILSLIWDRELPAAEIAAEFDVTFGAVSQHLAVLREAEFVSVRKDGNKRYYRADQDRLAPFKDVLEAMWGAALRELADNIESDEGTA